MNIASERLGGLECRVVDQLPEGVEPRLVVVMSHGFGAPGADLVPLGPELLQIEPRLRDCARFIFPAAPLSLDRLGMYGGRAWWHIDMARLNAAIELGEFRNLRNDLPEGLIESRGMLMALLDEVKRKLNITNRQIVVGGFSQGAMLSTDVALRMEEAPAGLCIFSGTLLCENEWRPLAKKRGPLPVIQSHGYEDQILPYEASEWLCDMLREAGLDVEFIPFHGYHQISLEALGRFAVMLGGLSVVSGP